LLFAQKKALPKMTRFRPSSPSTQGDEAAVLRRPVLVALFFLHSILVGTVDGVRSKRNDCGEKQESVAVLVPDKPDDVGLWSTAPSTGVVIKLDRTKANGTTTFDDITFTMVSVSERHAFFLRYFVYFSSFFVSV
jgi:hypothetical protein